MTLNTRYKGEEAAAILNDSGANTLFVVGEFLGVDYPALLREIELPNLQRRIVLRGRTDANRSAGRLC